VSEKISSVIIIFYHFFSSLVRGMSKKPVMTVGIAMPDCFPSDIYDELNRISWKVIKDRNDLNVHVAGSINAIAYRFRACADYHSQFSALLGERSSHEQIYAVTRSFFGFFVNGLASLESFYYAMYALGSAYHPAEFSALRDRDEHRISAKSVAECYERTWPGTDLALTLRRLHESPALKEWRTIRNVLAHRVQPPRTIRIHMTVGVDADQSRPDLVQFDGVELALAPSTTDGRLKWLSENLRELASESQKFYATLYEKRGAAVPVAAP
jgi:hypothetical protein